MTTGTTSGSVIQASPAQRGGISLLAAAPPRAGAGEGAPHAGTVRSAPGKERSRHTICVCPSVRPRTDPSHVALCRAHAPQGAPVLRKGETLRRAQSQAWCSSGGCRSSRGSRAGRCHRAAWLVRQTGRGEGERGPEARDTGTSQGALGGEWRRADGRGTRRGTRSRTPGSDVRTRAHV